MPQGSALLAQRSPTDSNAILAHLNAAISWYRHVAGLDITAGQPSDALYLENARSSASAGSAAGVPGITSAGRIGEGQQDRCRQSDTF